MTSVNGMVPVKAGSLEPGQSSGWWSTRDQCQHTTGTMTGMLTEVNTRTHCDMSDARTVHRFEMLLHKLEHDGGIDKCLIIVWELDVALKCCDIFVD